MQSVPGSVDKLCTEWKVRKMALYLHYPYDQNGEYTRWSQVALFAHRRMKLPEYESILWHILSTGVAPPAAAMQASHLVYYVLYTVLRKAVPLFKQEFSLIGQWTRACKCHFKTLMPTWIQSRSGVASRSIGLELCGEHVGSLGQKSMGALSLVRKVPFLGPDPHCTFFSLVMRVMVEMLQVVLFEP